MARRLVGSPRPGFYVELCTDSYVAMKTKRVGSALRGTNHQPAADHSNPNHPQIVELDVPTEAARKRGTHRKLKQVYVHVDN